MFENANNVIVSLYLSLCVSISFYNILLVLFLGILGNILLDSVHYVRNIAEHLGDAIFFQRKFTLLWKVDRMAQIKITNQMSCPTPGLHF